MPPHQYERSALKHKAILDWPGACRKTRRNDGRTILSLVRICKRVWHPATAYSDDVPWSDDRLHPAARARQYGSDGLASARNPVSALVAAMAGSAPCGRHFLPCNVAIDNANNSGPWAIARVRTSALFRATVLLPLMAARKSP